MMIPSAKEVEHARELLSRYFRPTRLVSAASLAQRSGAHADIPGAGAIVKNSNQSLRLKKWQRLEQDCLNEREDGDVAANSERQSHHANEKKSRRLYKCSHSVAQIGDEIFHRFVSCSL